MARPQRGAAQLNRGALGCSVVTDTIQRRHTILRIAAPILIAVAAYGCYLATSVALGASDADALAYTGGIGFQLVGVGAVTAWLVSAEPANSHRGLWMHIRQCSLLYIVLVGLLLLWPNAGHGSGVVQFTTIMVCAALFANGTVSFLLGRRRAAAA